MEGELLGLPIIDPKGTEKFTLRITGEFELTLLVNYFRTRYPAGIFAKEYSKEGVLHFHAILFCSKGKTVKESINDCRKHVKEFHPSMQGNGKYAITAIEKKGQAEKYTVKDGDILWWNLPQEYINELRKTSHKKFEGNNFQKELIKIRDMYLADEIETEYQFMEKYIDLKTEYGQYAINGKYLEQYVNGLAMRKYPKYKQDYIRSVLENSQLQNCKQYYSTKNKFVKKQKNTEKYSGELMDHYLIDAEEVIENEYCDL